MNRKISKNILQNFCINKSKSVNSKKDSIKFTKGSNNNENEPPKCTPNKLTVSIKDNSSSKTHMKQRLRTLKKLKSENCNNCNFLRENISNRFTNLYDTNHLPTSNLKKLKINTIKKQSFCVSIKLENQNLNNYNFVENSFKKIENSQEVNNVKLYEPTKNYTISNSASINSDIQQNKINLFSKKNLENNFSVKSQVSRNLTNVLVNPTPKYYNNKSLFKLKQGKLDMQWINPLNCISKGPFIRKNQNEFASYHLSPRETKAFSNKGYKAPMKSVPMEEITLLRNGKREDYLNKRWDHVPNFKYNFPEATSWRLGWFLE